MNLAHQKLISVFAFVLVFLCTLSAFAQEQDSIAGIWQGTFHLDFIFKIDRNPDGSLTASFNTPLQEVYNVPVKTVRFVNDSLYLGIDLSNNRKSHFTGVFDREISVLKGYFSDGVHKYPMTLEPDGALLAQMVPRLDDAGNMVFTYHYQPPPQLNDNWTTAHLAETGIDTATINKLMHKILREEYKQIHSLLIIKNGQLVLDEYFYGYSNQKKHFIASVTKSVTYTLAGIATDKGMIKNIHTPVCDYFPEYADLLCTGTKKNMQLYHLLSMSAGLQWDEQSYNYLDSRNSSVAMSTSSDGLRYLFERKLVAEPGEQTVYNSGLPVAVSEIIRKVSGVTIDKFAEQNLFTPLGIKDYMWEKHPDGTFHAGGGLHLLPRDMAKLGMLYMKKGLYQNQRLISEDWFERCAQKYMTGTGPDYWNHWSPDIYFINDIPVEVYSAGGLGGQFIYALPQLDALVIFTSDFFGFPNQMQEIMRTYLIPAFIAADMNTQHNNYTSKEIKIINNYYWQYHWLSEMACHEAGIRKMNLDISSAWLYGSTGNAFLININQDVSVPSINEAVNFPTHPQPALGYRIETIECAADAPEFTDKQEEAWDRIREAIDQDYPAFALQLEWLPEYYMIFGYDENGYYYKGIDSYNGKGPKLWPEVGINSSNKLSVKIMEPANKADDISVIKDALQFAVTYFKNANHLQHFTAGPAAYDVWAQALKKGSANGFGNALNAVTWAECRRMAVQYLKECKTKLSLTSKTQLDQAIDYYQTVSDNLNQLEQLFPFFTSDEQKNANATDPAKRRQAVELLKAAKTAELEGIKVLILFLENYEF